MLDVMRPPVRILAALLGACVVAPGPARAQTAFRLGVGIRSAASIPFAEELAVDSALSVRVPLRWSATPDRMEEQLSLARSVLTAHPSWDVVMSLRYQPPDELAVTDRPAAFASWAAEVASRLDDPRVSFDVTNRPNALLPDGGSDAGRVGVVDALVAGVKAADAATTEARVGFSWLATGIVAADLAWWTQLGATGGPEFAAAVDFVDVQLYPATHAPLWPAALGGPAGFTQDALSAARNVLMPKAGLLDDVPIMVGEAGFAVLADPVPFYWGMDDLEVAFKTETAQAAMLHDIVAKAASLAATYNVEGASWWVMYDDDGCPVGLCWGLIAQPVAGPDGNPLPPRHRQAFDELVVLLASQS
jgi:hypothetical protein